MSGPVENIATLQDVACPLAVMARRSLRAHPPHATPRAHTAAAITATIDPAAAQVMELVVRRRVHRVYIVDPLRRPVGIITCTDILRRITDLVK
jgi:CBS domain-containing protein